ncbi:MULTISPECIES: hypothetical protein [Maritimibacter]|uniref:Uncharacterized protein n=1 Tax=Maritimibacter alkaliphilus HTCC2654 TaxID=314271 RepID=A3VHT0_9RHOB|nr:MULTISPECIES: hypothetical protein [Maritimibacter]EAQ12271.1 hypothetical protein RB2654_08697 [Rhodobacterales bacterium HTCC2654] [Maritimibacter alkaliphilus HTCC2654]MBL6428672.1 hypothetical protein [Maritimibacter sp.]TYP85441.1 hypothetical protein BD830_101401 [Maritimibacter alkaliphilus HTCC2654]
MRAILVSLLLSSPAMAACPTKADLAEGVTLVRASPLFKVMYREEDGVLTEYRQMSRLEGEVRRASTYANALAVEQQESANGIISFDYMADMDAALKVDETGDFAAMFGLIVDGKRFGTGHYRLFYEGEGRVRIGDCVYDTWVLRNENAIEGMEPIHFLWDYAPDLGVVVRTEQVDPRGRTLSVVEYDGAVVGEIE